MKEICSGILENKFNYGNTYAHKFDSLEKKSKLKQEMILMIIDEN